MRERLVQVPTRDGPMRTFVTHPEEGGPFPAVIIYLDVWGLREELFDIARRVAATGYYCMAPDLFHREPDPVWHEFRDADGHMKSLKLLSAEERQPLHAITARLTNDMAADDTGALIDFMKDDPAASDGPMGAIGYCMGGRHVLYVAARYPRFRANVSLHGSGLVTDKPDSPHLFVGAIQGEVYGGFASDDPYAAPELIDALARALDQAGIKRRFEIHPDTEHGYALPDRDIFNKQAAERDWELIFALFHRQIPAY